MENWLIDVKKYVPNADEAVVAGIVRHCGIALHTRDASLVAFTDPVETKLVRESFLKRKLALTDADDVLDRAIVEVGEQMKADHTRNRVTVYYLLAQKFGKLNLFGSAAGGAGSAASSKKFRTEADCKASPKPVPMPGYSLPRMGGGQKVSLERGTATRNKKNPGKRPHQGG